MDSLGGGLHVPASIARSLEPDDIRHPVEAEISVPVNLQHDPEFATRGGVASGRDDQTKFFGKCFSKVAARSAKAGARGM